MPERTASSSSSSGGTEFGPRKTLIILAIVAGCFAILVPKIFYPMLSASFSPASVPAQHVDGGGGVGSGCCDVIFESDVTAVDIMQELCRNIARHQQLDPRLKDAFSKLTPASASLCREQVLAKCGIDLSSFLAEKQRLNKSYKQVLEEIRGFNGSLCLKTQFGLALARLGTPHLIRYHILMPHSPIRQERQTPAHAGSFHPAMRERGRAIPSSHIVPKIQDRPDQVQGASGIKMRPPMGAAAGHVVAAPKGNGFVGLLMPLYTIGIVIFFLYTLSKVLRKSSDSEIIRPEYSTASAEKEYQKIVFNPDIFAAAVSAVNGTHYERNTEPQEEPAPSIEELKEHQAPKSRGLAAGVNANLKDPSNVSEHQNDTELEEAVTQKIQVLNMEMTATCEGGQRYSRPSTPTLLAYHSHPEEKEKSPPISIYLEGALPAQCELLVTDSKTQELQQEESVEVPVVLSGKMTLSLISLDQESQDDIETAQRRLTSRDETSIRENSKVDWSSRKVQVLKQEFLDKEGDNESDYEQTEEDEEEEEEDDEEEEEEDEEEEEEESENEGFNDEESDNAVENEEDEEEEDDSSGEEEIDGETCKQEEKEIYNEDIHGDDDDDDDDDDDNEEDDEEEDEESERDTRDKEVKNVKSDEEIKKLDRKKAH